MIRFIDLGFQLDEEVRYFAWFDTIRDEFMSFSGEQTWISWEEFIGVTGFGHEQHPHHLAQRLRNLFPKKWPNI